MMMVPEAEGDGPRPNSSLIHYSLSGRLKVRREEGEGG